MEPDPLAGEASGGAELVVLGRRDRAVGLLHLRAATVALDRERAEVVRLGVEQEVGALRQLDLPTGALSAATVDRDDAVELLHGVRAAGLTGEGFAEQVEGALEVVGLHDDDGRAALGRVRHAELRDSGAEAVIVHRHLAVGGLDLDDLGLLRCAGTGGGRTSVGGCGSGRQCETGRRDCRGHDKRGHLRVCFHFLSLHRTVRAWRVMPCTP